MPRPTVRDTAAEMPNPPKRQTIEGIDNPMRVASGVPVGGHGDVAGMPIEHPDKASRASDDLLDNDDPEHQPKAAQLTASPTQTDGNDGHVRLLRCHPNSPSPYKLARSLMHVRSDSLTVRSRSLWESQAG